MANGLGSFSFLQDTWKESLHNKFKHERAPLTDESVLKHKGVYGQNRQYVEKAPSPVKKARRASIEVHTDFSSWHLHESVISAVQLFGEIG